MYAFEINAPPHTPEAEVVKSYIMHHRLEMLSYPNSWADQGLGTSTVSPSMATQQCQQLLRQISYPKSQTAIWALSDRIGIVQELW